MATLRTLAVNIVANAEPLRKGLADSRTMVERFVGQIGGMGGGMLKMAGIATAAAAAIKATTLSMEEFTQKEDSLTTLTAVLNATGHAAGLTATDIQGLAESLETTTKFADDVTIAAAGVLATFKNVKGDQFKDAIKSAQDLSTVFGGDLSSNAKLIGKALNDPAAGLAKLAKAGVQFTEQQKEQIKAMQASGNLIGAQKMILDQLIATTGGAAVAAGNTLSGTWATLKAAAGGLGETLFSIVVPVLMELARATEFYIAKADRMLKGFLQFIGMSGGATSAIKENAAAVQAAAEENDELAESQDKLLQSLQQSVDTFGMSAREAQIFKAAQDGMSEATIAAAKALDEQLTSLENHKKAQDEAAKSQAEFAKAQRDAAEKVRENGRHVFDETRTAAEKYQARLKDLQGWLRVGAIDWQTYGRAVKEAAAELANANGANSEDALGPRQLQRGQQETFDRIAQWNNRNGNQLQQQLVNAALQQVAELKGIKDELMRTRQNGSVNVDSAPPFSLI